MEKAIAELRSSISSMRQKGCEKIMIDIDFLEMILSYAEIADNDENPFTGSMEVTGENPHTTKEDTNNEKITD